MGALWGDAAAAQSGPDSVEQSDAPHLGICHPQVPSVIIRAESRPFAHLPTVVSANMLTPALPSCGYCSWSWLLFCPVSLSSPAFQQNSCSHCCLKYEKIVALLKS